jgi:hypothetical protein
MSLASIFLQMHTQIQNADDVKTSTVITRYNIMSIAQNPDEDPNPGAQAYDRELHMYNASVVKIYNAKNSPLRLENKTILFCLEQSSSLHR